MTEDVVVAATASHLRSIGWHVSHQLHGNTSGIDIVAQLAERVLHVEAKGSATIRNGEETEHHQPHRTNSAIAALGKAMMLWRPDIEIALALPRERVFRNHIYTARLSLRRLGITVLWVSAGGSVEWAVPHDVRETSRRTIKSPLPGRPAATCRLDVLEAARRLHDLGWPDFSPDDIVRFLRDKGSPYEESTIRTHVTSVMCAEAPPNHGTRYADLQRVGRGRYRLRQETGQR